MIEAQSILAALTLLMAAHPAGAASVPVTFTAEERPLKTALAGTPMTFRLFSDPACTSQVHEQVIPIENVNLITKLKQFTPKNDVKLPKTVAMQQTLVDVQNRLLAVTTPGNLHLTVTGTGVVPVAGACQPQAAQIPVPTCTDGIQNQGEGDVDCGGGCPRCQPGDTCNSNLDCQGGLCLSGTCQPTCSDFIRNQDETDVDCGGTICGVWLDGRMCLVNSDCRTANCVANVCSPP